MKKNLSIILLLILAFRAFAGTSENSAFDEVTLAYNSGFYPGVVDKATIFQKDYPDSIFFEKVALMKGDALIKMYRYYEAQEVLLKIEKKLPVTSAEYVKLSYLLGIANYRTKNYDDALEYFYDACLTVSKTDSLQNIKDISFMYSSSLLFAGRIFFAQNNYEKVLLPFEYVVEHGNIYAKQDFDEALQKLMFSYNQQGKYSEVIDLFNKFSSSDFSEEIFFTLNLYAAEAYEQLGKITVAYDLYSKVAESGLKNVSVIAMKKAYLIASESDFADPAEIFAKISQNFSDSPQLVCEFWIRLGSDAFAKKEFEKAKNYFNNVEPQTDESAFLKILYHAKIAIDLDQDYQKAEELLASVYSKKNFLYELDITYRDSFFSTYLQTKALLNKWNEIPKIYELIKYPDVSSEYLNALSFYKLKNYEKTIELLSYLKEKDVTEENLCLYKIYASALSQNKTSASFIYEKIQSKSLLDSQTYMEYAKNLYSEKNYALACEISQKSSDLQKDYLSGLCMNNLRNWEQAKDYFINYIKNKNQNDDFIDLAYYYKGYSEYQLNDWKNAYVSFVRYEQEHNNSDYEKYLRKAYEYAAKAAVQSGDYKNASLQAENLIKITADSNLRQNAIMFCAEVYMNIQEYNKAINILMPFISDRNEFAEECLYQIAKIYEQNNQIKKAHEFFEKVYTDFPNSKYAETSMFNIGELYFSQKNYIEAGRGFNSYIEKYPQGKYLDAALFFCGECNYCLGNLSKSILLNKMLVSDFSKSIYLYGAYKNLLKTYYQIEDYSNALKIAKTLVENYPKQAVIDGIGSKVVELERIVGGTDKRISEKITEYENLGKSKTKQGRIVGSELVKYYAADSALLHEAYVLAKEILETQKEDDESYLAAQNAEFIADYERKIQNNAKAAEMYLKSAELYRKNSQTKDNEVASVLYRAVEAFKAADLIGDASETSSLLLKLYPESNYAKRVKNLLQ